MQWPVEVRPLERDELSRIGEIDRTERIDLLYVQQGSELVARRGRWDAGAWDPYGHGEHSVAAQRRALEGYAAAGGIVRGAFSDDRLVGLGVVVLHVRPAIAQLAYLHVSQAFRSAGIGSRLTVDLELIARNAGDTEMVVTATPSGHTVRFDSSHGYRPADHQAYASGAVPPGPGKMASIAVSVSGARVISRERSEAPSS